MHVGRDMSKYAWEPMTCLFFFVFLHPPRFCIHVMRFGDPPGTRQPPAPNRSPGVSPLGRRAPAKGRCRSLYGEGPWDSNLMDGVCRGARVCAFRQKAVSVCFEWRPSHEMGWARKGWMDEMVEVWPKIRTFEVQRAPPMERGQHGSQHGYCFGS